MELVSVVYTAIAVWCVVAIIVTACWGVVGFRLNRAREISTAAWFDENKAAIPAPREAWRAEPVKEVSSRS
ncbi:MAG: hypothetical protein ACRCYQ_05775 [Nocardioides sp.]